MSFEENYRLTQKVHLVNQVNKFTNELWPNLINLFNPFINQQVLRSDNNLLKKLSERVDELTKTEVEGLYVVRRFSKYLLKFEVCGTFSQKVNDYYNLDFVLGAVSDNFLVKLHGAKRFRTDYTVEEIKQYRHDLEEHGKVIDELGKKLAPFE